MENQKTENSMSEILANDVRSQYQKVFKTIRGIVESFPESRWREPHGDEYYIPCRIAYHLAVVIDNMVVGGLGGNNMAELPYGKWIEAKAEDLPDKSAFLAYFDTVLERAEKALTTLTDEYLTSAIEDKWAWIGSSRMGMQLYLMRELSDHTGELNKMLIEDGVPDVWVAR
ncbi:MAG: DinB family protein [Oscillospiraceae bacterium]|nr:DinB family protein [Oscillospiraceae bacterium]